MGRNRPHLSHALVGLVTGLALIAAGCGSSDPAGSSGGDGVDPGFGDAQSSSDSIGGRIGDDASGGTKDDTAGGGSGTDGSGGVTEPPVDQPDPGQFGYPCDNNDECFSQFCVATALGNVCSKTCGECPEGWSCRPQTAGDPIYLCLPRWLHICDPCTTASDCSQSAADTGHYCIDYGEKGHFCGGECHTDGKCPPEFSCVDVPVGGGLIEKQCVPDSGQCSCSPLAVALELTTSCTVVNDDGACHGSRSCTQDGLSPCDALTAAFEICNGLDDDCNGATDDLEAGFPCNKTNDHGTCIGQGICNGGVEICNGPDAAPEQCNGLDDDCNGLTDDGYVDTDFDFTADCIDEDDDNDGILDISDNCPVDANTDQADHDGDQAGDACDPDDDDDGVPDVDDCEPFDANIKTGSVELCDGVDNDCDGQTDEDLCDDGNPCTVDSCQADGSCAHENNTDNCDDGSVCTQQDKCIDGSCQGFSALNCDDGKPCTEDICDPVVGCINGILSGPPCSTNPGGCHACEDGSPCTENDYCTQGTCVSGGQVNCDDGNPCTAPTQCNPALGGCPAPQADPFGACSLPGLNACQQAKCINGSCIAEGKSGTLCVSGSSDCPQGICSAGTCLPKAGVPCTTQVGLDLCQSVTVQGNCGGNGECAISSAPPGFSCPGCNGICIKCFFEICIPF